MQIGDDPGAYAHFFVCVCANICFHNTSIQCEKFKYRVGGLKLRMMIR